MNANLKKWIEALRSGKYKQTRLMLVREKAARPDLVTSEILPAGHCCLGVAAEVIGRPGKYPDLETFGLLSGDEDHLVGMNDQERKTFAEIADYLEHLGNMSMIPWEDGGHDAGIDEEDKLPWDPDHASPEDIDLEEETA